MGRITSQKRQKEMKRKENRLAKAARRAQKKLAQRESSANSHNATDVSAAALN